MWGVPFHQQLFYVPLGHQECGMWNVVCSRWYIVDSTEDAVHSIILSTTIANSVHSIVQSKAYIHLLLSLSIYI